MKEPLFEGTKGQHATRGGSIPQALPYHARRFGYLMESTTTIAACNLGSGLAMGGSFLRVNNKLNLSNSSPIMNTILVFLQTYIQNSKLVLDVTNSALSRTIFTIFILAALLFSMTLTAWGFVNGPQTPNKMACWIIVLAGSGLGMLAGVTLEEFFMVLMPVAIGFGLMLSSMVGLRSPVQVLGSEK